MAGQSTLWGLSMFKWRLVEPAGVPQHVGMNEKGEFRGHARPGHHALISGCGERCATFRDEDIGGCRCFAQELAQRPTFPG
jgi:hypothetical protein